MLAHPVFFDRYGDDQGPLRRGRACCPRCWPRGWRASRSTTPGYDAVTIERLLALARQLRPAGHGRHRLPRHPPERAGPRRGLRADEGGAAAQRTSTPRILRVRRMLDGSPHREFVQHAAVRRKQAHYLLRGVWQGDARLRDVARGRPGRGGGVGRQGQPGAARPAGSVTGGWPACATRWRRSTCAGMRPGSPRRTSRWRRGWRARGLPYRVVEPELNEGRRRCRWTASAAPGCGARRCSPRRTNWAATCWLTRTTRTTSRRRRC